MISNDPLHEEVFIDLYQRSPKKGFNIKAFEAIKRQQPIEALDSLLNLLEIAHELVGEKKGIIKFKQDPLSWGLWITGPVAYKPNVIYAHCLGQVKEFTVDSRSTLVEAVKVIVERKENLSGKRDLALKPLPKKDDELQCTLMGPEPSTCTHFQEAERAIDRDCLLDACTSLFHPFGLQPRHKDNQVVFQVSYLQYHLNPKALQDFFELSSIKDALVLKHLQPRSEPLVWIERLDAYFDSLVTTPPASIHYTITRPSPSNPQPWLCRGMRTMVLLFLHSSVKPLFPVKGRYVPHIFKAVFYASFQAAHPDTDLSNALVFNLASPIDRVALVQCVLRIRNQQRIHDDEEQKRRIWHGKVHDEDKGKRNMDYKAMLAKLKEMAELKHSISSGEETQDRTVENKPDRGSREDGYETDVETLVDEKAIDERDSPPPTIPPAETTQPKEKSKAEGVPTEGNLDELNRLDSGDEADTEAEDYIPRRKWKLWSRIRLF